MQNQQETIAAIATAAGRGGVGIVRVSGSLAGSIAQAILNKIPQPRYADYLPFVECDGTVLDVGLALFFPGPNSFTGEDVLELQGHGGPVVLDMLLRRTLSLGARLARPGEFAERAFLNDKIDLVQAEAIADLIDSGSEQAARSALRSLQGEFSHQVQQQLDALIHVRMYVESAIDFPEEEVDFLAEGQVSQQVADLILGLEGVLSQARQGCLLREGMNIVIAGQPNAGKSTLLNALSGRDSAIVTEIAGTTRDVLREYIQIDGLPVHVIDTAGLRETSDPVEQEGVRRAWREIEQADLVFLLIDATLGFADEDRRILSQMPKSLTPVHIYNKIDRLADAELPPMSESESTIYLSAKTGKGMEELKALIKRTVGYQNLGQGGFTARRRHLDALERALTHIRNGLSQFDVSGAGELLAEDLHQAQQALSEITGDFVADDLLGEIFSSFCIGK